MRRLLTALLVFGTTGASALLFLRFLEPGALSTAGAFFFALGSLWPCLGFWNAVIASLICIFSATTPSESTAPLRSRSALAIVVCNEDPELVFDNARRIWHSLVGLGHAEHFAFWVLSDTARPEREKELFAAWQRVAPHGEKLRYRHRRQPSGRKVGNLREMCEVADCDLVVVLDADSLMSGAAVVDAVRVMEREPDLGLLQTLCVARPTDVPFARIFGFGMRHNLRMWALGEAWWQGDDGPYWGHNAVLRVRPYLEHCVLPELPGGAEILSHDQVEGVLLRRGGWRVRALPIESGSFEGAPVDVLELVRRTERWCRGNLQYVRLLALPGLSFMSRLRLAQAVLMFFQSACWTLLAGILLATTKRPAPLVCAWALPAFLGLAPRLFSHARSLFEEKHARSRVVGGAAIDVLFSFWLTPVLIVTEFLAGIGVARVAWTAPNRRGGGIRFVDALRVLWPQTLVGAGLVSLLLWHAPVLVLASSVAWVPCLFAVPLAVLSAHPALGSWLARRGLCSVPAADFT